MDDESLPFARRRCKQLRLPEAACSLPHVMRNCAVSVYCTAFSRCKPLRAISFSFLACMPVSLPTDRSGRRRSIARRDF